MKKKELFDILSQKRYKLYQAPKNTLFSRLDEDNAKRIMRKIRNGKCHLFLP